MDEHTSHELAYRKGYEAGKPKWIPVTERLPDRRGLRQDEAEYVLVCEKYPSGEYVSICAYDFDGWSKWDSFGMVIPERITHWMPLPEPPKGE